MFFSDWLKKQREIRNIDGNQLAFMSGVTQSTISRIESSKIDPTMETVYRITSSLGYNASNLYENLRNFSDYSSGQDTRNFFLNPINSIISEKLLETKSPSVLLYEFPTLEDLVLLEDKTIRNVNLVENVFSDLVNQVIPLCMSDVNLNNEVYYKDLRSKDFFSSSPLCSCLIEYPQKVDEKIILQVVAQNGAVLPQDLYAYIFNKLEFIETNQFPPTSQSVLWKLDYIYSNKESIGKLKFSVLQRLDELIASGGVVFLLAWKAIELEFRRKTKKCLPFDIDPVRVSRSFLLLSRWLAVKDIQGTWLSELKRKLL